MPLLADFQATPFFPQPARRSVWLKSRNRAAGTAYFAFVQPVPEPAALSRFAERLSISKAGSVSMTPPAFCIALNSRQTRCLIPADGLREFFYSEQREAVPVPFSHSSDDKSLSGAMLAGLHAAQLQKHLAQRISRQFELRI